VELARRAAVPAPTALLVAERSPRAVATHALLHLVVLTPLCWALAGLVPHGWFSHAPSYQPGALC
jgi:hypothetical protein